MGLIDISGAPPGVAALDFNLSKDMAEALNTAYPGYSWGIRCEGEQGIATIFCLNVSGERGYVIPLKSFYSASMFKTLVIAAAGLILELYGLRRGSANESELFNLKHNFAGKTLGYGGEDFKRGVIK